MNERNNPESTEESTQARLAQECSKLDKRKERSLADEGFSTEVDEWPEY
jgi:hypothetical protein